MPRSAALLSMQPDHEEVGTSAAPQVPEQDKRRHESQDTGQCPGGSAHSAFTGDKDAILSGFVFTRGGRGRHAVEMTK